MTQKANQTTNEKDDFVTIPRLTVKKAHRVLMSPVRLPADLVAEAVELMNSYNMTPTQWHEAAWRELIKAMKRRERAALKEIRKLKDPDAFEKWCIENGIEEAHRPVIYKTLLRAK